MLIAWNWFRGYPGAFALTLPMLVLTGVGWGAGYTFRGYLALGCCAKRCSACCRRSRWRLGASLYLWFYAGSGAHRTAVR